MITAFTIALMASTMAATSASSGLRVLVRIDTHAVSRHVPVDDLTRDVRAIWKPYADIVFSDIADMQGYGFDDELRLVVSEAPRAGRDNAASLGWITFPAPGRPEDIVTVSVAAARTLAAGGRWTGRPIAELPPALRRRVVTRAISRSAAHEIGHYLLRSSVHAEEGQMRRELTVADIMEDDLRRFRLEPPQVDVLRRRGSLAGVLAGGDPKPEQSE